MGRLSPNNQGAIRPTSTFSPPFPIGELLGVLQHPQAVGEVGNF